MGRKARDEHTAVDVIEGMRGHPRVFRVFRVVDFEMQIRRHVGWLDRGEIRADYTRGRELLGEFYGPDFGSGGNAQDIVDTVWHLVDWGQVE